MTHPKNVTALVNRVLGDISAKGRTLVLPEKTSDTQTFKYQGADIVQATIADCDLLNIKLDPEGLKLLCLAPYGEAILKPLFHELAIAYIEDFESDSPNLTAVTAPLITTLKSSAYQEFIESRGSVVMNITEALESTCDPQLAKEILLHLSSKFSHIAELAYEVDQDYLGNTPNVGPNLTFRHALNNFRSFINAIDLLEIFVDPSKPTPDFTVNKQQNYILIEDDKGHSFLRIIKQIQGLHLLKLNKGDVANSKGEKDAGTSPFRTTAFSKDELIPESSQFLTAEAFLKFLSLRNAPLPDTVICDINLGKGRKTGITLAEELHQKYGRKRPFKLIIYSQDVDTPGIRASLKDLLKAGKIDGFTSKHYQDLPRNITRIVNSVDERIEFDTEDFRDVYFPDVKKE